MSRLQALETRIGAMTSVAQSFKIKEATPYELCVAFKMVLQSWIGSLHDNMLNVLEVDPAKEGRLMELDVRKAGMSQETVEDIKEMDRKQYHVLIACAKGEAKNHVRNPGRSGFKPWKQLVSRFDPRTNADRSVA